MWNTNNNWSGPGWETTRRLSALSPVPPDFINLRLWLDSLDVDGLGNTTLANGDRIAAWVNKGSLGGAFAQPTALSQPVFGVATGPGGAKAGVTFNGAEFMVSSLPASAFTFLHDGSGSTIYSVTKSAFSGDYVVIGTSSGGVADIGTRIRRGPVSTRLRSTVDAVGVAVDIFPANSTALNVYDVHTATLLSADPAPAQFYRNAGFMASQVPSLPLSALPPTSTMYLGSAPDGTQLLRAVAATEMCFAGRHTPAQIADTVAWIAATYGVTFPSA